MQVIIAIGFDGADNPDEFYEQVRKVCDRLGTVISTIQGPSHSDQWGIEEASWLAVDFESFERYVEARARILAIGGAHNQDAVAFTVGNTDVAECPKPVQHVYRDFR